MTVSGDKPEREATRSWNVPSLVRALMVLCVLGVVAGTGWYSWKWWQREVEREQMVEAFREFAFSPLGSGIELRSLEWNLRFRTPVSRRENPVDLKQDSMWTAELYQGSFDWYVTIEHHRIIDRRRLDRVIAHSYFRIPPRPSAYRASEPFNELAPPISIVSDESPSPDWRYVMDFFDRLSANQPTDKFDPVLIHSSWREGYKPDPRFDFGEPVE